MKPTKIGDRINPLNCMAPVSCSNGKIAMVYSFPLEVKKRWGTMDNDEQNMLLKYRILLKKKDHTKEEFDELIKLSNWSTDNDISCIDIPEHIK